MYNCTLALLNKIPAPKAALGGTAENSHLEVFPNHSPFISLLSFFLDPRRTPYEHTDGDGREACTALGCYGN